MATPKDLNTLSFRWLVDAIDANWSHTYEDNAPAQPEYDEEMKDILDQIAEMQGKDIAQGDNESITS